MTHQQLRDLMRERVADETMPDLSARAWQTGQRLRRRRRVGAVAGVVAATALVTGAVALVDSSPRPDGPGPVGPAPGTQTSTATPSAPSNGDTVPDGSIGSLPVFFAPSLAEEADLPLMTSGRPPLPEVIDPGEARVPLADAGIERAVVAMRWGAGPERSVVVVSPDGRYARVDTSFMARAGDAQGNLHDPERPEMLAPDGRHLAFPQGDHVMLLEVATSTWQRHDLPSSPNPYEFVIWLGADSVLAFGDDVAARLDVTTGEVAREDRPTWAAPAGLGPRASYYSSRVHSADGSSAQSWFSGRRVKGPGAPSGEPEVLVVEGGETVVAAFIDSAPGAAGGGRYLGCCAAAAWLGPEVVGYLSSARTTRLIAWHVGTDRFELVAEVRAPGAVSFADLSR